MTTPTPRTDAQPILDEGHTLVTRDFARALERELAALQSDLTRRDTLLGMIRGYPYIPQGLASLIDREVAGWCGKG